MPNYKMEIAYDGRRYKGFRKIKGEEEKTIQGKLENILGKLYEEEVEVIGAVNTDAGVSAAFQVVNFQAPKSIFSEKQIYRYFETYLPDDIIILKVIEADERFHARYNLKSISYQYRLWKSDALHRPLFERQQVKLMERPLNVSAMQEATTHFIGELDYRAFATKAKVKSTIKTVEELVVHETENEVLITITANSFLLNMERIIVGTLIQVGLNELNAQMIPKAFTAYNEKYVGHKAMSGALCLVDVSY